MRANTLRKNENWRRGYNKIEFHCSEHIKNRAIKIYWESPPLENTTLQEHLTHDCRAVARRRGESIRKFSDTSSVTLVFWCYY